MNVTADASFAVAEVFLYRGVFSDILQHSTLTPKSALQSLECLEKFLHDVETHQSCLAKLRKAKNIAAALPTRGKDISECDVQSVMAVHVFEPLVANSAVIADESSYARYKITPSCRFCGKEVAVGKTSIGNNEAWHGVADIMLEKSLVKVDNKGSDQAVHDETLGLDEALENGDLSEPTASKQPRLDDIGHGEAGRSDQEDYHPNSIDVQLSCSDTYMPEGPGKLASGKSSDSVHAQVLSQTIVNAFLQAKKSPELLRNSFIPAFLVSDSYVTIHMYNPGSDILLTQSGAVPIFRDGGEKLDTETILSLWLALNIHNFSKKLPNEPADDLLATRFVPKSNFQNIMKSASMLDIYKNKMERPLSPRDIYRKCKYRNCEHSTNYVNRFLDKAYEEKETQTENMDQSISSLHS